MLKIYSVARRRGFVIKGVGCVGVVRNSGYVMIGGASRVCELYVDCSCEVCIGDGGAGGGEGGGGGEAGGESGLVICCLSVELRLLTWFAYCF